MSHRCPSRGEQSIAQTLGIEPRVHGLRDLGVRVSEHGRDVLEPSARPAQQLGKRAAQVVPGRVLLPTPARGALKREQRSALPPGRKERPIDASRVRANKIEQGALPIEHHRHDAIAPRALGPADANIVRGEVHALGPTEGGPLGAGRDGKRSPRGVVSLRHVPRANECKDLVEREPALARLILGRVPRDEGEGVSAKEPQARARAEGRAQRAELFVDRVLGHAVRAARGEVAVEVARAQVREPRIGTEQRDQVPGFLRIKRACSLIALCADEPLEGALYGLSR
ncbi:MAG: hypothetical protein Q8Q09_10655 [Deltaproteobacteria bacterium]|nr:hypothetical protein [Deltaproteobacteria bacterium]